MLSTCERRSGQGLNLCRFDDMRCPYCKCKIGILQKKAGLNEAGQTLCPRCAGTVNIKYSIAKLMFSSFFLFFPLFLVQSFLVSRPILSRAWVLLPGIACILALPLGYYAEKAVDESESHKENKS